MLIFEKFESMEKAQKFASYVQAEFDNKATVYASREESDRVDPFPFDLDPPIVLVERGERLEREKAIIDCAAAFGGHFAGT